MTEVFDWSEGAVFFRTAAGTAWVTASFAEDSTLRSTFGWAEWFSLDGIHHTKCTGRQHDLQIGAAYSRDVDLLQQWASATALINIHMRHWQQGLTISAGYHLYSGVIQSFEIAGNNGQPYRFRLSYSSRTMTAY